MTDLPPDEVDPTPEPPPQPWQLWAPPLDPPTTGGLPAAYAQAIADAVWQDDPHMCAALQWESYAGMLPPTPAVANVSTGAQSVSYSPPAPVGDYGLAIQRAEWHRSLANGLISVPLTVPAELDVPLWGNWNQWWAVDVPVVNPTGGERS
jgi:hypothetical protein